jgi:transcriptional regulator with XRE-family HTH domain
MAAPGREGTAVTRREQAWQALGARLRELRRETGMTGGQFAAKLGWYGATRVSKLELGLQEPTDKDLTEWVQTCGALTVLPELKTLLNTVQTFHRHRGGVHLREEELRDLERDTTVFRAYAATGIPDLLQTVEYAQARLEAAAALHQIPATSEDAMAVLADRQQQLHLPGKQFHFILTEAALLHDLAGPQATVRQAEKILVISVLSNVQLGIIPSAATAARPAHGFTICDQRMVFLDTVAAGIRLAEPGDISTYQRAFEATTAIALYGDQARRHITGLAGTIRRPVTSGTPS